MVATRPMPSNWESIKALAEKEEQKDKEKNERKNKKEKEKQEKKDRKEKEKLLKKEKKSRFESVEDYDMKSKI